MNERQLKTLEQHNEDVMKRMSAERVKRGNGIVCPQCGAELFDEQGIVLTSNPVKYIIYCDGCDYRGTRL